MDLTVEPLKVLWALQEVLELHLVPSNLNPFMLIESPVAASDLTEDIREGGERARPTSELPEKKRKK